MIAEETIQRIQSEVASQYYPLLYWECRAAYRRGYPYLHIKIVPTGFGSQYEVEHSHKSTSEMDYITHHTRSYVVDEETVERLRGVDI